MKYKVIKTYVVEADSEEKARLIVEELEKKNQQWLFLQMVSAHRADKDISIWSLW
jgi:hypothetical protein